MQSKLLMRTREQEMSLISFVIDFMEEMFSVRFFFKAVCTVAKSMYAFSIPVSKEFVQR